MRNLKKYKLFIRIVFLVLLFSKQIADCQNPTYSPEIEKRINRIEQELADFSKIPNDHISLVDMMKASNVPGLSIAVIHNYQLEWARSYGLADKENSIPLTNTTLLQAASLSKSINAVGILKLVQDKKLDLNSDINKFLISWKFPYDSSTGKKVITIKHLLSHSAGTNIPRFSGYKIGDKIPNLIQILNGSSPANNSPIKAIFDAGIQTKYSGGGITITQLIVTDVTNEKYDHFMKEKVLNTLNMDHSFFSIPDSLPRHNIIATGYYKDGKPVEGKYHIYPEMAAASLWTNPTEFSNFIIEIQLAFAGKSNKILEREMISTMLTPVIPFGYGLGVGIQNFGNSKYIKHSGGNAGFLCKYIASMEDGNGVIVMTNGNNNLIVEEIINTVGSVYEWDFAFNPQKNKVIKLSEKKLEKFIGEYQLNESSDLVIRRKNKILTTQSKGEPEIELYAISSNTFFTKYNHKLEFISKRGSKVLNILIYNNGQKIEAFRKID